MTSLAFSPDENICGGLRKDLPEDRDSLDVAGLHCPIRSEWSPWPKPHALVETDCLPLLVGTRFEAQDRLVWPAGLVLDYVEKSLSNPRPRAAGRVYMRLTSA
jgi:hypothetical protein